MKVFLDANILFSGAQPHSRMRAFLLILFRRGKSVTNAYAIEEARRNLKAKFPDALPGLEKLIEDCEVFPAITLDVGIDLREKDRPILGGAIASRSTHLLTGDDRDFGKLFGKTVQGILILSPRMMADEFVRRGWL